MSNMTVAALQLGSSVDGSSATLEQILSYENEISQRDCKLLVMPEAILGGYPKGEDFGTRVGYRTDNGRATYQRYFQEAIDPLGKEVEALKRIALSKGQALIT